MKSMKACAIGVMFGMSLVVFMGELLAAPPDEAKTNAPKAADALILTVADDGKTVRVPVGRLIEIRLEGDAADTGWEADVVSEKSVERDGGLKPGESNLPPVLIFTPAKDAKNKAIGTYAFRYRAIAAGKATLGLMYVYPGGPNGVSRKATALVRKVSITIEVMAIAK